jgi:hypothetical protein
MLGLCRVLGYVPKLEKTFHACKRPSVHSLGRYSGRFSYPWTWLLALTTNTPFWQFASRPVVRWTGGPPRRMAASNGSITVQGVASYDNQGGQAFTFCWIFSGVLSITAASASHEAAYSVMQEGVLCLTRSYFQKACRLKWLAETRFPRSVCRLVLHPDVS